MAVSQDREEDLQTSTFDYISLRGLFFSQLSETDKDIKNGDFREFRREHPRNLVTRAVFIKDFWTSKRNHVSSKIKKSGLTAEQAWFGIRSIIKGSSAVFEYFSRSGHQKLPKSVWDDIRKQSESGKVSDTVIDTNFEQHHLDALVEVYNKYETWKSNRTWSDAGRKQTGWMDEMDLVIRATRTLNSNPDTRFSLVKEPTHKTQKIHTHDKGVWKKASDAYKFGQIEWVVEKGIAVNQSRKASKEQLNSIQQWINKVRKILESNDWDVESIPHERIASIPTLNRDGRGWPFWKSVLPDGNGWNVFWTTYQLDNGKPVVIPLGYSFNHDEQNKWRDTADHKFDENNARELLDELEIYDKISREEWKPLKGGIELSDVPGRGPARPVKGTLDVTDEEGNIALDDTQLRAIFDNYPLLIDGLPGTGKTTAVARRGALVAAASKSKKRVLVTCYNPSVIDRIRRDIQYSITHKFSRSTEEFERTNVIQVEDHAMFPMHYIFDNRDREKTQSNLDNQRRYHVENFEPDRYGYNEIIVDECQDLTQLEFEFLRKLAMKEFLDEDSLHMFPQLGEIPGDSPGR